MLFGVNKDFNYYIRFHNTNPNLKTEYMKAEVQYNDFVGTAAADISDHTNLTKYLKSNGVDTNIYKPIGARLNFGESGSVYFDIVCEKQDTGELVMLGEEGTQSFEEFLSLFKRFEVILTEKGYAHKKLSDKHLIFKDVVGKP